MPILKGSASDFTSTVKGSAEVNASIGGAIARKGGNSNPPRSLGAIAAIVTQSAIAKSSGLQPTQYRVLASTAPAPAPAAAPTFASLQLTNDGGNDVFVVKYNTDGGLNWVARIAGASTDIPYMIASDSSGNIYVCGFYRSSILAFYSSSGSVVKTLTQNGTNDDGFLAKYTSNGSIEWVAGINGTNTDNITGITVDISGNIYVVGNYQSSPLTMYNQDQTSFNTLARQGGYDVFIAKYNSLGFAQWSTKITGAIESEFASGIAVDNLGNLYVSGVYRASSIIIFNKDGSQFGTLSLVAGRDVFIVKYNTDGMAQWSANITGTGDDYEPYTCVDKSGNVYICGTFDSSILTINSSNSSSFGTLTQSGSLSDVFIVKYNSSGLVQWATKIGSSALEKVRGISSDATENIFLVGYYESAPLSIYNQNRSVYGTLANAGVYDTFIAKYNSSGAVQWITRIGGTGVDIGSSVSIDASGNSYVSCYSSASLTIYNSDNTQFKTISNTTATNDTTIVKYNSNGIAQWASSATGSGADQSVSTACDTSGNVIVVGQYASNPLTIYSKSL